MSNRRTLARCKESGQAALALVLGIVLLLVTGAGILTANAMQHDPLVQDDALQHFAYRALEAGINSYLNTINAQPNLVDCSTTSTTTTCVNSSTGIQYDEWTQVTGTTKSSTTVPEYYAWTNPQLCFSKKKTADTTCTYTAPSTGGDNFEYLQVEIVGAAGYASSSGFSGVYQSSVVSFIPKNGFLTHVWWSNYEASDPALEGKPATTCHYDWTGTSYSGPGSACSEIFFGPGDVISGPVFTNDSIYVTNKPVFGTPTTSSVRSSVTTQDPNCLFVDPNDGHGSKSTCSHAATTDVGASNYTTTTSQYGAAHETPPADDTQLEKVASIAGCVYSGPTTISLYATKTNKSQYMNVTSPETPVTGTRDEDNASTNLHQCTGTHIAAPTSAHTGNGVIFVEQGTTVEASTSHMLAGVGSACGESGASPLDGVRQGKATWKKPTTVKAQVEWADEFTGTAAGFDFVDGETTTNGSQDCAGDAFVRDTDTATTPSGSNYTPGIAGNLTIAAKNNVIITGDLKYTDCGSWKSGYTYEKTCAYNTGANAVNDSLGLIATNYVEVNHPVKAACKVVAPTKGGGGGGNGGGGSTKGGGGGGGGHYGVIDPAPSTSGATPPAATATATATTVTAPTTTAATSPTTTAALSADIRPLHPTARLTATSSQTTATCTTANPSYVLTQCTTSVSDLTAVLCNPGTSSPMIIDAAVLALNHSFAVNNYTISSRKSGGSKATGRLYIYGSVAQNWRGAVGQFSGSSVVTGYSKYYIWDSRLQYVSIPHYLQPGTPSWAIASSSATIALSCPGFPKRYGTNTNTPFKQTTAEVISTSGSPTKTKGPTGRGGVC